MGAKNRNTPRALQQLRLDDLRDQIATWYIDEKLTSLDIQALLLRVHNLDLTVGQVHYAFHRFGLKRDRNTMTSKHLEALRNRTYPMRRCKHCIEEFEPHSGNQVFCERCVPDEHRAPFIRRIRNYGVGKREFDVMLAAQGGKCGICRVVITDDNAAVDHDHITNAVRGLLCRRCNLRLSVVEDVVFVCCAQAYLVGTVMSG